MLAKLLPLFILLTGGVFSCTAPAPAPTAERPNVLFILTDDQGIGDLSLHGNDSIRTPNMDALLRSGARFSRFYVSPVCAPTRASFLSGQYAPRTGAVFVTRRRETMDDGVVTLAEHLRDAGYRTGLFGKWHNGATFPYHPAGQGFQEFLGFTLGHFNDYFRGELRNERDEAVPFAGDLTEILTDTAARFMTEDADEPFFAMLAYQAPHTPVQVADTFWNAVSQRGLTPYNTGIYAMVESVDYQIGRLLSKLEEAGELENTIVIFSTDNGPNGDRYRMRLRGTKGQVDEGGVRVPFGIRLPGSHPANGRTFDVPAAHIDLLPTVLDLLDIPSPENIDGVSLLPLLNGNSDPALDGRFIYVFKQGYDFSPWPGSMRNRDTLYVFRSPEQHEMYLLTEDEGQHSPLPAPDKLVDRYGAFAATVARPDLVAPPIDLDAAPGPIHLLAHEGEPHGQAHFSDEFGWANDFFRDVGAAGASWPIVTRRSRTYRARIRYANADSRPATLRLESDAGDGLIVELPAAAADRLPVADRVKRKEVYPRDWAEVNLSGLRIEAGATELTVRGPDEPGLWIKEVTLTPY